MKKWVGGFGPGEKVPPPPGSRLVNLWPHPPGVGRGSRVGKCNVPRVWCTRFKRVPPSAECGKYFPGGFGESVIFGEWGTPGGGGPSWIGVLDEKFGWWLTQEGLVCNRFDKSRCLTSLKTSLCHPSSVQFQAQMHHNSPTGFTFEGSAAAVFSGLSSCIPISKSPKIKSLRFHFLRRM